MNVLDELFENLGVNPQCKKFICLHCGNEFRYNYNHSQKKYCSRSCGQRSRRKSNSYVKLKLCGKRRKEHVVIMEKILGRKLHKHEEVHHKNGIKNDNSVSNLELWSHSHPPGQRVEDKIKWARDFIKLYENNKC